MRLRTEHLRREILGLSTPTKRAIGLAADLLLIPTALWLAFFLRLGTDQLINPLEYYWLFLAALVTAIPVFILSGLYRAVIRYLGRNAITTIFKAVSVAALLLALVVYWARSDLLIPRTLVFNYWILLFALVGATRFAARAFLAPSTQHLNLPSAFISRQSSDTRRRVAIYGAGAAGYQLFSSIQQDKDIKPVAFIDDDPNLQGRSVSGLRIYSRHDVSTLIERMETREIFLAIPSLDPPGKREILEFLEEQPVHIRTVPSVYELTTGRKALDQLQEVRIEDILGRDVVPPAPELLEKCIRGKVVMVTGAGGSIGSELCRQIMELKPSALVLFEHSEFNLFTIEEELRADIDRRGLPVHVYSILGSILDETRLKSTISQFGVNTIYHAAAYKHVPIVEHNIAAGLRNNVVGTLNTAQAAIAGGVENFVLISTDKAVRPTNIMGASKRMAELVLQALSSLEAPPSPAYSTVSRAGHRDAPIRAKTRFTIVRFGNVLGSSGSVIPKFRAQIAQGGPVTVTHPNVTRYFMTISEAANLVIQASSMGMGGDVFVLDMGQPVKILDLATKMIRLSGLSLRDIDNPDGDIEITFSGLRPGEKLYEELLIGDNVFATGHTKIRRAEENALSWEHMDQVLADIQQALAAGDLKAVQGLLLQNVDGFQPHEKLVDWTYEIKEEQQKKAELLLLKSSRLQSVKDSST